MTSQPAQLKFRVWAWQDFSALAPDAAPIFETIVEAANPQHAQQLALIKYWGISRSQADAETLRMITHGEVPERNYPCRWRTERCG